MEHEAYSEMAATEDAHWWFHGRRRVLEAVIARLGLPEPARILELGSGTGGNFEMLSRFGSVTAVEANDRARALSLGKSRRGIAVLPGSLPDHLPNFETKFDLVCLFDVLEHVEEDERTLRNVRTLLAPGAALVVTVPAFARLWGRHDERMHHKRRYERAELKAKLRRAGFDIQKLSYCNMLLFPAALAARLADRLHRPSAKNPMATGAGMLPYPINRSFAAIFGAERFLIGRMDLPIGLSLLAVARAGQIPALNRTLDQM